MNNNDRTGLFVIKVALYITLIITVLALPNDGI